MNNLNALGTLLITFLSIVAIAVKLLSAADNSWSVAGFLSEGAPPLGFEYAIEPRPFEFPKDHSSHPKFRSEWWYFTGNVNSETGSSFGFQLTLFRFAFRPQATKSNSPWRRSNVYLGHFAISDFTSGVFHNFERQGRPALGLAGVRDKPPRIWIRDWSIELIEAEMGIWQLKAQEAGVVLDVKANSRRPITVQGDQGLSKKSEAPGNASFYYSIPRLAIAGSITTPTGNHQVYGNAWFDHEWSTSALADGQLGWDWFSLQLSDGRDIMFYQIRDRAGRTEAVSHGMLLTKQGVQTALRPEHVQITVTQYWQSPTSNARYPAAWQIRIPTHGISIRVLPRMSEQEWNQSFVYWEGAVVVTGESATEPISGTGYVELVGYN